MPEDTREILTPAEQTSVVLYGREVVAVRLPDGRVAAVFSSLCDALQLSRTGQIERIHDDEVLRDQLLLVEIATAGGTQAVNVLTAWAIPVWLQGVQLKRLAEEKRPAILAFKREAADVLYRHFAQRQEQLPSRNMLVPAQPIAQPTVPATGAAPTEWLHYHQQMIAFLEWQNDIEQWRGTVESRLESVEEVTRLVPELLERLGPQTLSPAHQASVQAVAKRLHELTDIAFATIYSELNQTFHVAKYSDIPESQWANVAAWLKARIDAATKKHSSKEPHMTSTQLFPSEE